MATYSSQFLSHSQSILRLIEVSMSISVQVALEVSAGFVYSTCNFSVQINVNVFSPLG